jgi:hypothetical protein
MMVAVLLAAASLLAASAFAQDATLDQVYRAASSGNLPQAERMMDQVLRDHPNSAKAHYVQAEILARQGRMSPAQAELATAERLQPGLSFAKAESVQDLQRRIAGGTGNRSAGSTSSVSSSGQGATGMSGIPWGMLVIGLVIVGVIFFAIRALRNRGAAAGGAYMPANRGPAYAGGPQPGQPYGAPYPGGGMAPGMGGGLGGGVMGGLATGAALGAGMVAGQALAHRLGEGHSGGDPSAAAAAANDGSDLGGNDFGVADASSWDDGGSFGGVAGDSGSDWS